MQLRIRHKTTYTYDHPVSYALQQIRLMPRSGHGQTVLDWRCSIAGGTTQVASYSSTMHGPSPRIHQRPINQLHPHSRDWGTTTFRLQPRTSNHSGFSTRQ